MNERPVLADRLARHLDEAASNVRLRPAPEGYVVRAARRRSVRRHRAIAAVSVAAVVAVTVFGVRELTSTNGPKVRTGNPLDQPDTATTAAPGASPAATTGDPQLVWRTVHPDSAAAVGTSFGVARGSTFPGMIVSTSPGRAGGDGSPTVQLWRSDDGIAFSPVNTKPERRSLISSAIIGHTVYAFGTAPGAAKTDPSPLLASVSSDDGATWADITLPINTHAATLLAGVESAYTSVSGVAMSGRAVMVVVDTYGNPDLTALGGDSLEKVAGVGPDGVSVLSGTCTKSTATTIGSSFTTATVPDVSCPTTLHSWDELGLSPAAIAVVSGYQHQLLYAADGRTFTAVALPTDRPIRAMSLPNSTMPLVATTDDQGKTRLFRLTDANTWTELPAPPTPIDSIADLGGRLVALDTEGVMGGPLQASTFDGTSWSTVDIGVLAGTNPYVSAIGSGPAGLAVAVFEPTPATTPYAGQPTTTVTMDGNNGPIASTVPGAARPVMNSYILHTLDGVTWSVEPLTSLLGSVDEQNIRPLLGSVDGTPWVTRIASVGNQLVVTVSLQGTGTADRPPDQVVLVGTPRG